MTLTDKEFILKVAFLITLISALLPCFAIAESKTPLGCPFLRGSVGSPHEGVEKIGTCEIKMVAVGVAPESMFGTLCETTVQNESGQPLFDKRGYRFELDNASGQDLNGDGFPEVIIRSDDLLDKTARQPFHYIYSIVTCGGTKPFVKEFKNGYGVTFRKAPDGRSLIVIPDDGFQNDPNFTEIYLYDVFMPEIRFELQGARLVNVSTQYRAIYDEEIERLRKGLSASKVKRFRDGRMNESDRSFIEGPVLKIVFSLLYSGRELEAWQELDRLWPKADIPRIKSAILEARKRGSLRLADEAPADTEPNEPLKPTH